MNEEDRAPRIATWSVRHPVWVTCCWVMAVLLGVIAWRGADHLLVSSASIQTEIESRRGSELIAAGFDDVSTTTTRVVCAAAGARIPDRPEGPISASEPPIDSIDIAGCYEAKWEASARNAMPGTDAYSGAEIELAPDGQVAAEESIIRLLLPPDLWGSEIDHADGAGMDERIQAMAREDVVRAELVAIPLTLLILLLVIRTRFSPIIPIVIGGAAVTVAIGLTAIVARWWHLSIYVVNMIVMLGLAVGIDYTLLSFERYREERRGAAPVARSIAVASTRAGHAVIASGVTVIIALAGMLFVPISVIRDVAMGAMLVVLLGVIAVLTLLPAMLRLFGERIDPKRPHLLPPRLSRGDRRGFWARWAATITRCPLRIGIPVLLVLVALATQAPHLRGGLSPLAATVAEPPNSPTGEYWQQELALTLMSVVEVVIGEASSDSAGDGVALLVDEIGRDHDFAPFVTVQSNEAGDLTVVRALVVRSSDSDAAARAVDRLRTEMVPVAFGGGPAEAYVSGPLALRWDVAQIVEEWQPRIIAFVLATGFVALAAVFRSAVVPLLATLSTLLSVTAAIGVLVLVVQKGYGASLLGIEQSESIAMWVPLVLFSILFGLSMDYHVFLVSRIRERYERTEDTTEAVRFGIHATGRIICAAALIMGVVFASFATGRLVLLQQLGLGLAVAVLIDAFLVRLTLVPAVMTVLGRWNWYAPDWRRWLPWRGDTLYQQEHTASPTAPHRH